jgi:hypothetical protein
MKAVRFAAALFVSALLMFSVQPMIAKAVTPLLGGAPAVWITCMLFFQALLLLGYAYAHASLRFLGARKQAALHLVLLLLPLLVLPVVVDAEVVRAFPRQSDPSWRLLLLLLAALGAPFFVLATSAPLLQGWFARVDQRDPYVLYAASNLGSVVALAAYPALVEPFVGLATQTRWWHGAYVVFVALSALCALSLMRARDVVPHGEATTMALGWRTRAAWFVWSFVPSAYLMSVTTYITTDVAPIPLFWVLPLLLYLVTFIVVFGKKDQNFSVANRWLALGLSVAAVTLMLEAVTATWVHLTTFFLAAMVCHGRLAQSRPEAGRLTEFYLWLSIGGVSGGLFNALVAPAVFSRIAEYPLALVLAALCRKRETDERARPLAEWGVPLGLGALTAGILLLARGSGPESLALRSAIAIPALANYATRKRPLSFALGLTCMLLASTLHTGVYGSTLFAERNFFGVVRVSRDPSGRFHQIVHGSVIHGRQYRDPARMREPLSYYHRKGPLGDVFTVLGSRLDGKNVAAVGLGAGAIASYRQPSQAWTFYEINPSVVRVAQNPAFFTFLRDAFPGGRGLRVELGDARLRLADAAPSSFGLIVLDAFSSDAVPTHLLTREAMRLYLEKLTPDGHLVFHVSNRYLDLVPVVARIARDSGLRARVRSDLAPDAALLSDGLTPSEWMVAARDPGALEAFASDWRSAPEDARPAWTDDYSNVLSAYRF